MTPAEPGAEPAAPGAARPVRWLTPAAFASEAEATSDVVERLLEAGVITARPDGRLAARDEVIASTAQALLDAGIRMDDLIESISTGQFGLRSLALIFSDPVPRTARPYAAITSAPNADPVRLSAVYAALGLPEPEPEAHPRADEAELLLEFVRLWNLVDPTGDAQTRVARIVGDATRRIAEGWLDVWDEVAQPGPETQGAPTVGARPRPADPTDPAQNPSIGMAEVGRRLVTLMHERHLQATLNARILSAFERALGEAGRRGPRPSPSWTSRGSPA